jgi:hypothetical protein
MPAHYCEEKSARALLDALDQVKFPDSLMYSTVAGL